MIDFHVHQPAAAAYGPAEYLTAMDELGVDLSVVFTYEGLLRPSVATNDSLAAWVAPAPGSRGSTVANATSRAGAGATQAASESLAAALGRSSPS